MRIDLRRAVGGKLFGTCKRLIFIPNRIDSLMGGFPVEIPNGAISSLSKTSPTYSLAGLFSGAFRSRLCIQLDHGKAHLFVVNRLDRTIQIINYTMAELRTSSDAGYGIN